MRRMMLADPKSILNRLTNQCKSAMEAAVSTCVAARHYEVTVEHVLLKLLDDADSDLAFLVMHYDLNPAQLRQTLQRSVDDLRTGNAGKPVISPMVWEWMQDGWSVGSLVYGHARARSGMLFQRLVEQPSRYSVSGIGSYLEGISKDDL
jgi:type VI secretion system protein VasG